MLSELLERVKRLEQRQRGPTETDFETGGEEKLLAHRLDLRAQLDRRDDVERMTLEPLREAERRAADEVRQAEEQLKAARQQYGDAAANYTSVSGALGLERARIEMELRSTASPAIRDCS